MPWILAVLWLLCSASPTAAQGVSAGPVEDYAGSETCGVCHEDISQDFQQNAHWQLDVGRGRWKSEGRGCEACHGPGAEHSETIEVDKIVGFKTASSDLVNKACLACHAGEETHSGRLMGSHQRNSLSCVDCHSVHAAHETPLLKADSDQLCSSCHVSARASFNRPFRHKLQEKAVGCIDCHNPHGDAPPASLNRVCANETACLKCHSDKRGPFPFEHAPVRLESCTTCHEPHGSANPRMLIRHRQSQLCLECHAGSFGALGGIPPDFHDLRSSRFQNCTVCHSKIHGSFVSRDFLR